MLQQLLRLQQLWLLQQKLLLERASEADPEDSEVLGGVAA